MGKGTIGINPFFHDRTIMSPIAVSGLLSLLVSFIDAQKCEWADVGPMRAPR
jgi:26S proteasome regulatory subunit N1